ncbi:hypothetical protein [Streptomyces sp. NPDC046976]|uniref:hypothetical protein n=1 Tax=Streptomyces sp. NPDC046976 TaxID=3155258 RepID=UPI0033F630F1
MTDYVESAAAARAPIRKAGSEPVADANADEMPLRHFAETRRRPLGRRPRFRVVRSGADALLGCADSLLPTGISKVVGLASHQFVIDLTPHFGPEPPSTAAAFRPRRRNRVVRTTARVTTIGVSATIGADPRPPNTASRTPPPSSWPPRTSARPRP